MTFENAIKNERKDDEVQLPWPNFPYKEIEEWFSFVKDQKVFYYLKEIFSMHVIYVMKKEYPAQKPIVLPWSEIPIQEFENWLEVANGDLLGYLPSGISSVQCVTIGKVDQ